MDFEQVHVNGEIWLPKRAAFRASARLALPVAAERHFLLHIDSKIVPGSAVEK